MVSAGKSVADLRRFSDDADVKALLLILIDEVRALRHAVETQNESVHRVSRADRERLGRLLPVIAGVYGSEPFTSRDLVRDGTPALRPVLRGLSPKSIGRLLTRATGIPIGGLMVQRDGTEINVALWSVVEVLGSVSHGFESGTDPRGSVSLEP